jgi:hypothetical protein
MMSRPQSINAPGSESRQKTIYFRPPASALPVQGKGACSVNEPEKLNKISKLCFRIAARAPQSYLLYNIGAPGVRSRLIISISKEGGNWGA